MRTDTITADCFPNLSNDYGSRGKAFSPRKETLGCAKRFLRENASLAGLAIALIGAVI